MSIDPYGTIRAQVLDLQGNAVGGAVSNNDWRLVVDNENLVFQHYDATANDNAGAYITRQSFGTGLTGISVVPLGTYSITGNLQVTDDLTVDGGTLFVDSSTNRVGFGTVTPSQVVHIVGNTYLDGDLTVTGSTSLSSSSVWTKDGTTNEIYYTTANVGIGTNNPDSSLHVNGTSKFVGNMTLTGDVSLTGHIVPAANNTYDLGSATNTFRHVYVGPGSLYVNGKQVITDDSNTITVSTSINQNLALKTSGTGNLQVSTVGTGDIEITAGGIVQMKKTLQILDGQKITSSGGTTVVCGNNFQSEGSLRGVTLTLDGSTSIGPSQLNVLADATVGSGVAFKAVVLDTNKDFSGIRNLSLTGDLTVAGTTTTVNSTTVSVADGMFKYAANNAANATDFGWYGKYVDSSVTYYSGMFRDATDNKMRFFTSTQVEPTTTVDVTGTGYAKADVVVGDVDFTSGTMRGHILPDTDDTYDIGSAEFKIRDMYVSDSSLWVGDNHKITIDSGGKMKFRKRKTSTVPAAVSAAGGTEAGAKTHSGKGTLIEMKLKHWKAYMRSLPNQGSAKIKDIFRATADDYEEETGADAWLESGNNVYLGASGNVGIGDSTPTEKLEVNGAIKIGDAATTGDGTIKYASGDFLGRKAGSWVSLTAAGGGSTAETVTTAAQPAITSVGTLTTLQVDNININGNIISSTAGTDLKITPLTGQQIVLDDTIVIDAGVVTGATSITSTSFVGALTGNATTATTLATARTIGGVSFNGSSNINLPGVNAAGNQNTTGNAATATTAGTVTTAAQPAITSVGTLTSLTVSGDLTVNGTTTTVNTTNIVVEDSLIQLASANAADSVDIGMYGKYVSGSTYYTGLVRDASAGGWHLFTSTTAPSSAGVANLSYSPLRTAALTCTTINASGNITGTLVGNASTATTAGTVTTAAQPAITSVGTLTGLTVNGGLTTGTSAAAQGSFQSSNTTHNGDGFVQTPWIYTAGIENISEKGSAGTGMFFGTSSTVSANDVITFVTNGADRLAIDASGNVGIGTTNPQELLHIQGSSNPTIRIQNTISVAQPPGHTAGTEYGSIDFWTSDGNFATSRVVCYQSGGGTGPDCGFKFYVNENSTQLEAMNIKHNGNVGIGTNSPECLLHLSAGTSGDCVLFIQSDTNNTSGQEDDNPYILFGQDSQTLSNADGGIGKDTNNNLFFSNGDGGIVFNTNGTTWADGTERMRIDRTTGNVGIGDNTPSYKLDVNGTGRFTSNLTVGGTLTVSGNTTMSGYIGRSAYNSGFLVGGHNNLGNSYNKTNPIYTMGSNYIPTDTTLENMYGIGYTYGGGTCGSCGPSFITGTGLGYGMYVASGGDARVFLGAESNSISYINTTGNFGLGTDSPSYKLDVAGTCGFFGNVLIKSGGNNGDILMLYTSDNRGRFGFRWDGSGDNYNMEVMMRNNTSPYSYHKLGRFENDTAGNSTVFGNFTGQHRCMSKNNLDADKYGLIVYSTGKYINTNNVIGPTMNDSLPICNLCSTENDVRVFGVISDERDDNDTRVYGYGAFKTFQQKATINEKRIYINSLGEGSMWVCNKNGNVSNGSYISCSSVSGYGMKQDSNQLLNSTVAKITCDCNFNLTLIVKQKIKVTETTITKQREVRQDVTKTDTEIVFEDNVYKRKSVSTTTSELVYDTFPLYDDAGVALVDDEGNAITHKVQKMEDYTETTTQLVLDSNGNVQYEDDLDANGQQQMKYEYDTRFLNADGTIIATETEYNTKKANGENVYISCFVGCTYHCG